jgi:hypothetical protein
MIYSMKMFDPAEMPVSRRAFSRAAVTALSSIPALAQLPGERPQGPVKDVTVINPADRVPVSLIIDDSTCLANLAHFGIPHFAEAFPDRYKQDWKSLPREIPDSFVRKFGEWCRERGVKGKYSMVPYPACVGWLDRDLPGWSRKELEDSLKLVRTLMVPNWDIHPEMVSHTWVIDTKTGRPLEGRTEKSMENFGWSVGKSADELAGYLSYALRILKNAGLPCEGITTPGGFGGRVLLELSQAVLQSCRDIFGAEIPHYFRHAFLDQRSVAPRVEYASGLSGPDPKCVVSAIACTSDWTGGWDGLSEASVDHFITPDLKSGRMVDVIRRGEPAIIMSHWPGIYYNGQETGFKVFQEVVKRLHSGFDNLAWMKLSEIARYWAAKELTAVARADNSVTFRAPFACPLFTVRVSSAAVPKLTAGDRVVPLKEVTSTRRLAAGTWTRVQSEIVACFDLQKGVSRLEL